MHYIVSSTPTNLQSFRNASLDKSYSKFTAYNARSQSTGIRSLFLKMERTAKRVRPASFKIEIPGSVEFKENFMKMVHKVREALVQKLPKPVNNADIFEAALDSWTARLPEQDGGARAHRWAHQRLLLRD